MSLLTDPAFPAAVIIAALLLIVAAVLAVAVAVFLPLILFVLEIPIVATGIFFFGRPCAVEAWPEGDEHEKRTWRVRGWRAARRAVAEVTRELQQGVEAAPDDKLLA
jgi:ABC-type multidrug transport system fused ATPase/permease subunit